MSSQEDQEFVSTLKVQLSAARKDRRRMFKRIRLASKAETKDALSQKIAEMDKKISRLEKLIEIGKQIKN